MSYRMGDGFKAFCIGCAAVMSCACTSPGSVRATDPNLLLYERYASLSVGQNESLGRLVREVRATLEHPENSRLHWEVANRAYSLNQLPLTLVALGQVRRLSPSSAKAAFNEGVVLASLGMKNAALSRFRFLSTVSESRFASNRATSLLMRLESGGSIRFEDYFRVY